MAVGFGIPRIVKVKYSSLSILSWPFAFRNYFLFSSVSLCNRDRLWQHIYDNDLNCWFGVDDLVMMNQNQEEQDNSDTSSDNNDCGEDDSALT